MTIARQHPRKKRTAPRSKEWQDSNGAKQIAVKQGKRYTDEEMRNVFRNPDSPDARDHHPLPPLEEIAKKLGRKPRAIQNMRQWATYSPEALAANRKRNPNYQNSRFLDQILRIATEMKWQRAPSS